MTERDRSGAPEPGSPTANLREAAKGAKGEDGLSQAEKFTAAAREHATDQDEAAFKGVLRKLGMLEAEVAAGLSSMYIQK